MPSHEFQKLVDNADKFHDEGKYDNEIDLRLKIFSLFKNTISKSVYEIEKAANLLCDIGEQLDDPSSDEHWKQITKYANSRHGIIEGAILELVLSENPERAFLITQRIKSQFIVRRLRALASSRKDLSKTAIEYKNLLAEYDKMQHQIHQFIREKRNKDLASVITQIKILHNTLNKTEELLRKDEPKTLANFGTPLKPHDLLSMFPPDQSMCLADMYLAGEKAVVLLAFRNGSDVDMIGIVMSDWNKKLFLNTCKKWLIALHTRQPNLIYKELINLMEFCHKYIMCNLGTFMRQRGIWQVTIIPHIVGHAIPFHLSPLCETGNRQLFWEQFAVTYSPCVQLALSTSLRTRPVEFIKGELEALIASDPNNDLLGAKFEQKGIGKELELGKYLPTKIRYEKLIGKSATVSKIQKKMVESGLIVFGTHAQFRFNDPSGSGLFFIKDNTPDLWTIDEIYASSYLKNNPVVILSACESGMVFFDDAKEVVGLPAAFVCIGSAGVLCSLWPVEDISASIMSERFVHHLLDPGERPATALHEACKDVKNISKKVVLNRCDEILDEMDQSGITSDRDVENYVKLSNFRKTILNGSEKPFESPYFWGGYYVTGNGWRNPSGKGVAMRTKSVLNMTEGLTDIFVAQGYIANWNYGEAEKILHRSVNSLDGMWLGRALTMLGDCILNRHVSSEFFDVEKSENDSKEALPILEQAYDILKAHNDIDYVDYCEKLIVQVKKKLKKS